MKKKELLLFDIDNCLSDSEKRRKHIFGNLSGILKGAGFEFTEEDVKGIYFEAINYCITDLKTGGMLAQEFAQHIQESINITDEAREQIVDLIKNIPHVEFVIPGAREVLESLAKRYLLGVQSDGNREYQLKKLETFIDLFDPRYVYTFSNKSEEIWPILEDLKKQGYEITLIDDKPEYVRCLENRGYRVIHVNYGMHAAKGKDMKFKEQVSSLKELLPLLLS